MRIINNRHLLSNLFACYNAYLFSDVPKKNTRGFSRHPLKQSHPEESQHLSFKNSRHIQTWEIHSKNQKKQLRVDEHQAQYLGLKHLQEAFKSRMTETELKKTCFQSSKLSSQAKKSNSQTFIKLICHSISREGCQEIINLIEAYCEELRTQVHQKIDLIPPSLRNYDLTKKGQDGLFKRIRSILLNDLLLDENAMKQNTEYVNHLMTILAEADLQSISAEDLQQDSIFSDSFDYRPKQIRKLLNFEYLNQVSPTAESEQVKQQKKSQVNQQENESIIQQALKLRQNKKSTRIRFKNQSPRSYGQIKIKVAPEEDIFFTKIEGNQPNSEQKVRQSRKYLYLYDLPYAVNQSQCKDLINHLQFTKEVKVASYKLLTYNNYLQLQSMEKTHHLPDYYQASGSLEKVFEPIDYSIYLNPEKSTKKEKNKEKSSGLSSTTQALLKKIKKQKYSLFNRSVLILKFASEEEKNKLFVPELRLYGLNYKNLKNIKFEQGFSKKVLKVHGIPSGCTTTSINEFLNKTFKHLGYNLEVENDLYLSKNYILIQFQYFVQVLQAMDLLQNRFFQEKTLKAEIYYGSSKVFKGEFSTSLHDSQEKLKKRVEQVRKKYYKKNHEGQF